MSIPEVSGTPGVSKYMRRMQFNIELVLSMKSKLRKLKVDKEEYLWRCTQKYEKIESDDSYNSVTKITMYSTNARNCKLIITFTSWEDPVKGNPLYTGMPINLDSPESPKINLNRPKYVRQLLYYVCSRKEWDPNIDNETVLIPDGMRILKELGYEIKNIG